MYISDAGGDKWYRTVQLYVYELSGELNANRPVPFRLTPNIAEFLTIIGVTGPLTAAMLVTARCFVYPPYKIASYLSAILRDEYITWHKKVLSAVFCRVFFFKLCSLIAKFFNCSVLSKSQICISVVAVPLVLRKSFCHALVIWNSVWSNTGCTTDLLSL